MKESIDGFSCMFNNGDKLSDKEIKDKLDFLKSLAEREKIKGTSKGVWSNSNEMEWLDNLGSHKSIMGAIKPKGDRIQLLRKYLESISVRVRFGHLDKDLLEGYANLLLLLEEKNVENKMRS